MSIISALLFLFIPTQQAVANTLPTGPEDNPYIGALNQVFTVGMQVQASTPADAVGAFKAPIINIPKPTPKKVAVSPATAATTVAGDTAVVATGSASDAQTYARAQVDTTNFTCLLSLWNRESGWDATASNGSSGAYGIPQALPGSKMASAGADWQTNYRTQINWGLGYIAASYGSACNAWAHSQKYGWY